jgi:catechol 2,3-dioxygenase-like lactoylglutathione lyase family enzyme
MKRFHVHIAVKDLAESTRFYAAMFGVAPTVVKDDYAKWMLDDPRVNFAISARGAAIGVNHLGVQAENDTELKEIYTHLVNADHTIVAEENTSCCYAKSDKYWVTDPSGIAWESFHSLGSIPVFGTPNATVEAEQQVTKQTASVCCAPLSQVMTAEANKKGACCG